MNGFFAPEALEALQQAYEMQLTPDEMDIDQVTGLPTNQVSNTSPWHGTVDLWKYPNGVTKTENGPIMYHVDEEDEDEEYDEDTTSQFDEDEDEDTLSDEEIDNLIEELLFSDEDED